MWKEKGSGRETCACRAVEQVENQTDYGGQDFGLGFGKGEGGQKYPVSYQHIVTCFV